MNGKDVPEFLGVDVTFGVNKEKRELLILVGIDRHKKPSQLLDALCLQNNKLPLYWFVKMVI